MKQSLSFIFLFLVGVTAFMGWGCANIVPPSGGFKDSLPPVLLRASPRDSTLNFRGKRITLDFNEYVDLQDVPANVVVSPLPVNNWKIDVKLRTITVAIKDTLEPNTTYNVYFGNAVKDINEGNVLKDFNYSFSTGPSLDSSHLTGKVVLAESGAVDSTLIVMLHRTGTDSAVRKVKPRYIAKLNGAGAYTFHNLPAGTFYLYALGDLGGTRMYLNTTQLFAFADTPVIINGSKEAPLLQAYKETTSPAAKSSSGTPAKAANTSADRRLRFTTNLSNNKQDLQKKFIVTFEQPLRNLDTARLSFYSDSTFNPVAYTTRLDSARKALTITTAWKEGTAYHLIVDKDFAEDTLGHKLLKTDTLSFITNSRTDYGNLRLRFKNVDTAANPVLQFIQNGAVVFSASIKSGLFVQPLFYPGEYELRVLFDKNGNGVWDAGQFFGARRQPEIVRPLDRKITVKAAAGNDLEISL